jgi:hypothetical protein
MATSVPLTDEERAAVDGGHAALDHLLKPPGRHADAGRTHAMRIGSPTNATLLPVIDGRARCKQPRLAIHTATGVGWAVPLPGANPAGVWLALSMASPGRRRA